MLWYFWKNKKAAPGPTHSHRCQLCSQRYSCERLNAIITTLGPRELHTINSHELTLFCSTENFITSFTCFANWTSFTKYSGWIFLEPFRKIEYSIRKHSASVGNSKYFMGSKNGEAGLFLSFLSWLQIVLTREGMRLQRGEDTVIGAIGTAFNSMQGTAIKYLLSWVVRKNTRC